MKNIYCFLLFSISFNIVNLFSQEGFGYPVGGTNIVTNCYFNNSCAGNGSSKHAGIDFKSVNGYDIKAVAAGKIQDIILYGQNCNSYAGLGAVCNDHGMGNTVIIAHRMKNGGTRYSQYSHLDQIASGLTIGMVVTKGTYLGVMGATGQNCRTYWCDFSSRVSPTATPCNSAVRCGNTHLHFEIKTVSVAGAPNGEAYWGYTPNNASNYGYDDPYTYLSQTTNSIYQAIPHPTLYNTVSSSFLFDWSDISGVTNYRIQVKKGNRTGWSAENGFTSNTTTSSDIVINNTTGTTSQFTPSFNLEPNTTYYWTVRAANNSTSSFYAPVLSFTTAAACNPPTGISSSNITSNSAKINWTLDATNTNSLTLEWSPNGTVWNPVNLPANYRYNDLTNLLPNTTYYYRLRRNCSNTNLSNYSPTYSFRTLGVAIVDYCGNTTLTGTSGAFSDGSGSSDYRDNTTCTWIIQPGNVGSISIAFSAFATEANYDFVRIRNAAGALLSAFSGTSLPATTIITGNYAKVEFSTDGSIIGSGWLANYTTTPITTSIISGGMYKLTRQGTNKVLDASGCGTWAGTNVQLWDDWNNDCQKWIFQWQTDGFYEIKRKGTNMNLDAASCHIVGRGANAQLYDDLSNDCQRWAVELQSDGSYEIKRKNSILNLDAQDCGSWTGANVQLWDDNNYNCQRWILTYLGLSFTGQTPLSSSLVSQTTNAYGTNRYHNSNLVVHQTPDDILSSDNLNVSKAGTNFEEVRISPNPSRGMLTFDVKKEDMQFIDIRFFNTIGQEIKRVKSQNTEGVYQSDIDVSSFSDGIYYVHIFSNNELLKNEKIVIHK